MAVAEQFGEEDFVGLKQADHLLRIEHSDSPVLSDSDTVEAPAGCDHPSPQPAGCTPSPLLTRINPSLSSLENLGPRD